MEGCHTEKIMKVTTDTIMGLVRSMYLPNLVEATIKYYQTTIKPDEKEEPDKNKWGIRGGIYVDGTNTGSLGLVMFSAVLGLTLGKLGHNREQLLNMFVSLSETIMMITGWII